MRASRWRRRHRRIPRHIVGVISVVVIVVVNSVCGFSIVGSMSRARLRVGMAKDPASSAAAMMSRVAGDAASDVATAGIEASEIVSRIEWGPTVSFVVAPSSCASEDSGFESACSCFASAIGEGLGKR